jgi:hypothetical protein
MLFFSALLAAAAKAVRPEAKGPARTILYSLGTDMSTDVRGVGCVKVRWWTGRSEGLREGQHATSAHARRTAS